MSQRSDSPNHRQASDWPRRVLEQATVGYAVIESDDDALVWRNAAFDRIAGESGVSAAELASSLAREDCRVALLADGDESTDLKLIEVLPAGEAVPSTRGVVIDEVTGVLDRASMLQTLRDWCASQSEHPFALVFLDLDDFKSINDKQGHLVGDRCLRQVGDRLKTLVRAGDVVGRYGGDEFLILLQGVHDEAVFKPVERRLRDAIAVVTAPDTQPTELTASFGVAYSADCENDAERLIEAADRAMYARKRVKPPTGTNSAS
ncbi:MAG: GGDEF domain-containing protein [Planctomycetota bacterium]